MQNLFPGENSSPILITGLQKSGTSAIAGMLAHSTGTKATIDVFYRMGLVEIDLLENRISFQDFLKKANCYFKADIVKEPEFVLFVNELAVAFPESKRVFIVREPFDNLRSILNRLNLPGDQNQMSSHAVAALRSKAPLWLPLLIGLESNLSNHNYIECLANRWADSVRTFFEHADDFILVRYEDFIAQKSEFIKELAEKLEIDVVRGLEKVIDKPFQPPGVRACPLQFFGESNCRLILEKCDGLSNELGYATPDSLNDLTK